MFIVTEYAALKFTACLQNITNFYFTDQLPLDKLKLL